MMTTTADNLTRDEARSRAAQISDCRYDIELDLTTGDQVFGSTTSLAFRSRPGESVFVDLTASGIERIIFNGQELSHDVFEGHRIALTDLAEENELQVVATCEYTLTGTGLHFFRDPVDKQVYLHTQFEPFYAHKVFACFDQPDLKGTFAFRVLAPHGWEVVSNMDATTRPAAGGRWAFAPTPVVSSYITAIVAGPYHVVRDRHRDIDLAIYCRQSLAKHLDPDEFFEVTKQGLDYFEKVFASPYPFGKYDQLFVPEFKFGAMENAGAVTFTEGYIFRSKVTDSAREGRASTLLHEMAHMWFGDLVTMQWWDDLWLNESFATYMGNLAVSEATRFTNVWAKFASGTKAGAYGADQRPSTHPVVADIPDAEAIHLNFDAISYNKGAGVLKQLVALVGSEAFFKGCQDYFKSHAWKNTTLKDFLSALERSSGRDLQDWSKEWLETAGVNTLKLEFETTDGLLRRVRVIQEATDTHPTLRSHRLVIGCYNSDLVRTKRIELDVSGASTEVSELEGSLKPDLLLLNDEDLAYAKMRLDPESLKTVVARLRDLSDPVARALCWWAAWDMTLDAEMRARDFCALVLNNIGSEPDISMAQSQLGRTLGAIYGLGAVDNRQAAIKKVAIAALEAVRVAEAGSDFQLAWANTFIGAATTPSELQLLRDLLDDRQFIEGLEIDTAKRWAIVHTLVTAGAAGEELVNAEWERDPTDAGRRHVDSALAAMPTTEAKQSAWTRVTEDQDMSLATLRALAGGFAPPNQEDLLRPYVSKYFDTVLNFWESRGIDLALAFAAGMFPKVAEQQTIDAAESFLAKSEVPAPVRRLISDGVHEMHRSLRARAKDAS